MIDLALVLASMGAAFALIGWAIEYRHRVRLQQERDNLRAQLQPKPIEQRSLWLN